MASAHVTHDGEGLAGRNRPTQSGGTCEGTPAQVRLQRRTLQHLPHGIGDGIDGWIGQHERMPARDFAEAAAISRNNRCAAGHRLDRRHRPSFEFGWMNEKVGRAIHGHEIAMRRHVSVRLNDIVGDTEFPGKFGDRQMMQVRTEQH